MGEQLERLNIFAGSYLDRQSHLREQDDWLARAVADPGTMIVPVWQNRNLFNRAEPMRAVLLGGSHSILDGLDDSRVVLLGQFRGASCLLVELEGEEAPTVADDSEFHELRFHQPMVVCILPGREPRKCGHGWLAAERVPGCPRLCLSPYQALVITQSAFHL